MRLVSLFVSALVLLAATACAPAQAIPPTVDVNAIYTAAIQTISVQLTETARPTATDTATPTLTPSPTLPATATSTPGADFSRITLKAVGPAPGNLNMMIFSLPGLVSDPGEYRVVANGVKGTCARNENYPDMLYCSVDFPNEALVLSIQILPADSDRVLYAFTLEATATPSTPPPQPVSYFQGLSQCTVEPLYQPQHPELTDFQDPSRAGCFAITCQRNDGGGTCGTSNSCINLPAQPCP